MEKLDIKVLTATRLAKLFIAGSRWVSKYADVLNDLNVYPVPDGDTGTNMSMTLQAIENDLIKLNEEMTMEGLIETVSEAVLLGARGNSGTILSQILQGFLNAAIGKTELDIKDVVHAFERAKEYAYNSVTEPVEGTILTVIREISEAAKTWPEDKDNFVDFLSFIKNVAYESTEKTIDMLPKLKEAGVVDAGAKGLFYLMEGFEKSITDEEMLKDLERIVSNQAKRKTKVGFVEEDLEYKYCTEFIIMSGDLDIEEYKERVSKLGNSMIVAKTSKKTKTHIHTNNPGQALEIAGEYGELTNIKIDNMAQQHRSLVVGENEKGFTVDQHILIENLNIINNKAFVAIADTIEMAQLFLKVGATGVLLGGQSKNPSVSDIEEMISQVEAEEIIILPNNKNIISTANLVCERSKKNVILFETRTMLEGYYVLKNRKEDLKEIVANTHRNKSIEITIAARDTKADGLTIKKGNYIALVNGKLKYTNEKLEEIISDIYRENITKDTLRIFAVKGKHTTKAGNDMLVSPEIDIEVYEGQQENYNYYIYIENRDPNLPEIAIVTDSAGDISKELIDQYNINLLPIIVNFGKESYKDFYELKTEDFWERILNGEMSKTAHPSTAEMRDMYNKLFAKGYKKIISIHMSSKMSGLQQSARLARTMTGREKDIQIVDSKAVTIIQGHLVIEAAKRAKQGESFENIVSWLEIAREKSAAYFVVNDLKYLEKGGRIGKASAAIGGVLKLKPILKIDDGEVSAHTKVLGEIAALKKIERLVKEQLKNNSIIAYPVWGGTSEEFENAEKIRVFLEKQTKVDCRGKINIGPVVGSHSGPIYGVVMFPKLS
jgi:DAK2 domain fusion protein YloV